MLKLTHISLVQFKNYLQSEFSFSERIVGICGQNGVGKTNLLDAIYYLCFTRSYFTRTDGQNVYTGREGFRIEGNWDKNGELDTAICILRETGRKEFLLNDDLYPRVSQHIGKFPCVIIAPDDVAIITEGSEMRRRFLDTLLAQLSDVYLQNLIAYTKVLQQRNSYLKSVADNRSRDTSLLDVYDHQLLKHGSYIFIARENFLKDFLPEVTRFYKQIAQSEEKVEVFYESQLRDTSFELLLNRNRERDFLFQRTNAGIHRDDLLITFNGMAFKTIASQGQRKSLLFALKLAEFEALKESKNFPPLLLLDDVFEKLDEQRMHNLLHWVCVHNDGQIFLTDTHPDRIRQHFSQLGIRYQLIELA